MHSKRKAGTKARVQQWWGKIKKNVKEDYEDTKYSQNNWENTNKLKEGESVDKTTTDMGDTWGGNGKQVETITETRQR